MCAAELDRMIAASGLRATKAEGYKGRDRTLGLQGLTRPLQPHQCDVPQRAVIGDAGEVGALRLATAIGRGSGVQQPKPRRCGRIPRDVAVTEHEYVGVGERGIHPNLSTCRLAGLVYDGEPHAVDGTPRYFWKPSTQVGRIVVPPYAQHLGM